MSRHRQPRPTRNAARPVSPIARVAPVVLLLVLLGALAWPGTANACAVCYGEDGGSGFVRGARWATLLMIGVTYTLIAGGVVLFVAHRRRFQRTAAEDSPSDDAGDEPAVDARGGE